MNIYCWILQVITVCILQLTFLWNNQSILIWDNGWKISLYGLNENEDTKTNTVFFFLQKLLGVATPNYLGRNEWDARSYTLESCLWEEKKEIHFAI